MPASLRILLVDDEPDLLHALSLRLTAAGLTCDTAPNGKTALEKLQQGLPDLIIADLLMPEMDGFQFLRQLKADARTAAIPVIVLTAIPKFGLAARGESLEAVRVLHKPFEFDELLSITRALLPTPGGSPHG